MIHEANIKLSIIIVNIFNHKSAKLVSELKKKTSSNTVKIKIENSDMFLKSKIYIYLLDMKRLMVWAPAILTYQFFITVHVKYCNSLKKMYLLTHLSFVLYNVTT